MATCRTPQQAYDAGLADSKNDPPPSQEQVDLAAAILASQPAPEPKASAA